MMKTNELKKWMVVSLVAAAVILRNAAVAAEPQVPCLFIFGDSLIDPGNNNDLSTIARVNFRPYGIDFPLGPTGRFSNGKTVADVVAKLLGFKDYIPSYSKARGKQILRGVNYASAAAGIRPETGRHWGDRVSFDKQLRNFNHTFAQLAAILGGRRAATDYLGKCIFISALGNNEFLNNYFLTPLYNTSRVYTLQQYIPIVLKQYTQQLKVLYTFGARKIALIGTAPLGCIPISVVTNSLDGFSCVESNNRASRMFNKQLRARIDVFNTMFAAAQFIYLDGYNPINEVYNNAQAYGFKVRTRACCGSSIICLPNDVVCPNRSEYVFWDFAHPTEAASLLLGRRAYQSQKPSDAYPFDLRRLAQL
ncbi:GDSL esterase/lipase At5g45670-like [Salvia miltiorrhiza]|uniref:GDSL esterase/lipase At5g45670-like n=1 Tax=Salvia miltiorrhiza TaxID=226208 RepID=UPI0025ACC7C6|nr:GDSL esterase/lipase At5g45670-like [Salvia miltiorrhiza]